MLVYKRLLVRNIDPKVTKDDLSQLFGLQKTDFLKKNCSVEIKKADNGELYATVILPEEHHVEMLKLNGIGLYDCQLAISDDEDDDSGGKINGSYADATTSGNASNASGTNEEPAILYMLLDVRNHPDLNFPTVSENEVCDALVVDFPNDPHKAVKTYWGAMLGTFAIESANMEQYIGKSLTIRGHSIPLVPVKKNANQPRRQSSFDPDGTKVRIFDAYQLRYRGISHESFNDYFTNLGVEIIRQTQPERCKERREIFNTNRFIVVKNIRQDGTRIDLGERIVVEGVSFKLSYYGIERYCAYCDRRHGWDCPTTARFEFLKMLRKGKTHKCKMYSDSTMRHTNQLALSTNVACMSGGGIGQMCNLIPYDKKHDEVIINGGTNDIKIESLQEFAYTVCKTEEKLRKLASENSVTVVLPPIQKDIPEMSVKGQYLSDALAKVEVIKTITLENIEMDDTNHPTLQGTRQMIDQIHSGKENGIILENCEDDVVIRPKYRQVHAVFKAGCRGCDNHEYTPLLCKSCEEEAKGVDITSLQEKIIELKDQLFPAIDDVEMKEGINGKRFHRDNDEASNSYKVAKSNQ